MIWTAQYRYSGPDRLDITAKSKEKVFAPTWEMVMGYKSGAILPEEYTVRYCAMMEESRNKNKKRWDEIVAADEVTLVCFCAAGAFCHRVLLAQMLKDMGAPYMGERIIAKKGKQ